MGTRTLIINCLLCITALHSTSAQENGAIKFSNAASPPDERFKIPEITRDERYDEIFAELVADSVMRFAHDLGVALDNDDYPDTQIFSPLSVMSALSLLEMGAGSNSYKQLLKLFPYMATDSNGSSKIHEEFGWLLEDMLTNTPNLKRPRKESEWRKTPFNPHSLGSGGENTPNDHTIRIANGLFIQEGFSLRPDYRHAAQSVYKSEVMPLDFRTRSDYAKHYINSWINQNTLGKIPAIITDEVSSETNMIIASALYFKGFWEQPFLGSGTGQADFYPDGVGDDKPVVKVMMMGAGGVFPFYNAPEYDCRIVGLPYKGNQTTMYVIVPNGSTRQKLSDLQKTLTGDMINEMIKKMEYRTGVIAFPKFHVSNTLDLKDPLIKMGIKDIFVRGESDLSLITDAERFLEQAFTPSHGFAVTHNSTAPALARVPLIHTTSVREESIQLMAAEAPEMVHRINSVRPLDRFNEPALILRFSNDSQNDTTQRPDQMKWTQTGDLISGTQRRRRSVTYKVESEFMRNNRPLRLKDLILSKRITKSNPGKKLVRSRRQVTPQSAASLQKLDDIRFVAGLRKSQLYVDNILHKVDFDVNEQGTEAAAATLTWLRRSGTDFAVRCDRPFMIVIRHDVTHLPLFYGKVNIPL